MTQTRQISAGGRVRQRAVCTALCLALAASANAQPDAPQASSAPAKDSRAARAAYIAGARALDRNHLAEAERSFARAAVLDPQNKEYPVALEVARQHQITELIQQASRARQLNEPQKADMLLAQARAIDPHNPLVLEHGATLTTGMAAAAAAQNPGALSDRARLVEASGAPPWKLPPPVLAGAIHLKPAEGSKDLHLRGDSRQILEQITGAFGIHAVIDDSVEHRALRFDMDHATYDQAISIAMTMAHVFSVPLDPATAIFARDSNENRLRLEPQLEETLYVPAMTAEQINELASVVRQIFGIARASVETTLGAIVVRAPESVLIPLNETLRQLIDSDSEIVLDVKLYETDITRSRNIGATLPTQAGIYSVDAAAQQLVQNNQTLVQQAIAQGYVSATASNLQIALALVASGLVQSSLLSSTIGFFGNGLTLTGVTETGSLSVNLALNETDTRALDDVEMHLGDSQTGTLRSGTRYPIISSTYTSGISSAASSLSGASINGVSVASLLSQYSGGSSVTIPQVQYEDLGLTVKATPAIQRSGRISLTLDMKVEALSGSSLDSIPILNSRQFASRISVKDGETAMLVSNLNRSESAAVSGLPGLSELPGFQVPLDSNTEKDSSQLVVLITPHVVRRRMNPGAGPAIRVPVGEDQPGAGAAAQPENPQPATPAPGTPAPAAPGAQPGTPGSTPANPSTQPTTPGSTPGVPGSTPASPPANTPANAPTGPPTS